MGRIKRDAPPFRGSAIVIGRRQRASRVYRQAHCNLCSLISRTEDIEVNFTDMNCEYMLKCLHILLIE